MVSVGVLAALVNVVVLFLVGIADRCLSLSVRNFVSTRLHQQRSAPIVHDSDTWLPNIPRSLFKFRKHPLIFIAILSSVFLLASEIVTEIGVDVSNRCRVISEEGRVIPPGNVENRVTDIELGASAMVVNRLEFVEEIDRVPAGVPKQLLGSECFSCMANKTQYPDIVSECSVRDGRVYQPGELIVSITTYPKGSFGTVTESFTEVDGEQRRFFGMGDVTGNGENRSSFVFHDNTGAGVVPELLYLEYNDQEHILHLFTEARRRPRTQVSEIIKVPVATYLISCGVNVLEPENFLEVVMLYRMIQLESQMDQAVFNKSDHTFQRILDGDVLRAVLSAKVMDDDTEKKRGEYFRYTTCGFYKWKYISPFAGCLVLILLLGVISVTSKYGRGAFSRQVPYNSRSWFRRALAEETQKDSMWMEEARPTYFEHRDEMVMIEEGIGVPHQRIILRSAAEVYPPNPYEHTLPQY